jgi:hypothetical protein
VNRDSLLTAASTVFPEASQTHSDAQARRIEHSGVNEFVVFTKPEISMVQRAEQEAILGLMRSRFQDCDVILAETRLITGEEFRQSGAMSDHYGVINKISTDGREALTADADHALEEKFGRELKSGYQVYGGHQFLAAYSGFTPLSLAALFANATVQRLGPGAYASAVTIDSDNVIILNGFHPRQLEWFTRDDTACWFLHCFSDGRWSDLRQSMIGSTDPEKAEPDSIRGRLFREREMYGLKTVSSNFNGVHMSAGPLEALAELMRFFAGGAESYKFTARLTEAGLSREQINWVLTNPVLSHLGKVQTAFDLTEELDSQAAADLLGQVVPRS